MSDLTPRPASSATPPSPPRTPGWVKLGTGLAVIGAEITESVLHPAAAEALGIADAAIPLIVGLILFTTIVRGSPQTTERIFGCCAGSPTGQSRPPQILLALSPPRRQPSIPRHR